MIEICKFFCSKSPLVIGEATKSWTSGRVFKGTVGKKRKTIPTLGVLAKIVASPALKVILN